MWQRVQTLYLFISTVLAGALFFCDKTPDLSYVKYTPYLILLIVITLLNILALTCWKFRVFQMRTAILAAIITLALQAWIAVDFFTADKTAVFNMTAVFPFACVVLDCLAAKGILADELLVRSSSRLRSSKRAGKR